MKTDLARPQRKRIGEILKEIGYLTEAQLREALAVQAREGGRRMLGQILVSRGYVTPARLRVALAKQKAMQEARPQ